MNSFAAGQDRAAGPHAATAAAAEPFDLLLALDTRLRAGGSDLAAGTESSWTGLAFRVRQHWLIAPREDVREVLVPPRLTRVPGGKPWLLGVANVRGSLLPVSDLGLWLGWAPAVETRGQRVLSFHSERLPAGLLVDEVVGYRSFTPADQRPEHLSDSAVLKPYLLGAFVREERIWRVLSLHRLTHDPAFVQASL